MKSPDPTNDEISPRERWLWIALFAASFAVALALLVNQMRSGSERGSLDRDLLDLALQRGASTDVDTSAVTVILVDDVSLSDRELRWPLPRAVWAEFVDTVSTYEPAALVLTAWFEVPETNEASILAEDVIDRVQLSGLDTDDRGSRLMKYLQRAAGDLDGDRRLFNAISQAGTVVLGHACLQVQPWIAPPEPWISHSITAGLDPRLTCRAVSGNHPAVGGAAAGEGMLNLLHDSDDRWRRYPYLAAWQGKWVPSLALEAMRVSRPDEYQAALHRVATIDGAAPILRAIPPEAFEQLRFSDILLAEPGHPAITRAVAGRIVVVGVSAQGTEDFALGALDRPMPGTFVHANAIVDLLGQRYLQSHGSAALWGLVGGVLLLLALYLGTLRIRQLLPQIAIAVVAAGLWLGVASWRMSHGDVIAVMPVWLGIGGWLVLRTSLAGWRTNRSRKAYRAAKQRMEGELAVGREIQESLLPPLGAVLEARPDLDAHAVVRPAREVGGDLYDLFALDDGRICLCVGDVTDKGVPAALFMAATMTLIESLARLESSPASIARRINDELSRNNDGAMFVTLFLAVLDTEAGTLTYTNAGHNPPYLRTGAEWTPLGDLHGPVLGAMEELDYAETEVAMAAGDLLVAYTDGVTEAMDSSDALYGDDRLVAALAESTGDEDAPAMVEHILADVARFEDGATQADDITVLVVRYSSTASPS